MNSIDDATILLELKQGNIKAYQYFFLKYYKPLCLKAHIMLGNIKRAQEVVQQTFIRVWEQKLYLEIQQSVGGYFYQQVHLDCSNFLANNPETLNGEEANAQLERPSAEQQELRNQVLTALDRLPAEQLKLALEDIRVKYS